jgi:antitoxin VapB
VEKVFVRDLGKDRGISPIENAWHNFFLNGPDVSKDFMIER